MNLPADQSTDVEDLIQRGIANLKRGDKKRARQLLRAATIPIHRIQDVEYKQTVAKRLIGVSNLKVESAGEKGEVLLKDLSRGRRYDDTILSAIHEQEARLG